MDPRDPRRLGGGRDVPPHVLGRVLGGVRVARGVHGGIIDHGVYVYKTVYI